MLLPSPFNPKKSSPPPTCKGDEGMIEGVRGTSTYRSWKGGSICLESSAEPREYMLTYFLGKGTYFYWGDGSIYLLGGRVEILGG